MELVKRCVFLALALLQVGDGVGCGGRTECRVVLDDEEVAVVECAGREGFDETRRNISCGVDNSSCVEEVDRGRGRFNVSELTEDSLELSDYHLGENESNSLPSKSTVIRVNLLGNVPVLDLSYFSNATTVIMNTYGFNISNVCGAKNVSNLTVISSGNLSFIRDFVNLRFLNLTYNSIEDIPNLELLFISSIDLSFNNLTLNKTYSLPPNLDKLNISYNNISNNEEFILKGNVIVLDIRGNKLIRVPAIDMKGLEELYLSNNDITTLPEKTFVSLVNLTTLNLRANRLNDIEEKAFLGLTKLQWLDLSENNLISLAPATFQYLSNLVTLLLAKNVNLGNLQDFEDASLLFGTGQRLQEIEASGTNLSKIPSTVTRSVRRLLLANNSISTIQCGEVDSFPLLQVIDVSNNMIVEIEEDALGRLEFLSDLILAGNMLENVPKSLPNQLQILDLRCNKINTLNDVDFLGLQKLRVLLLSKNNISIVEDGAFGQLINLDVLDLSYNPIKTLYRSSFTGPRRLKELYLIALGDLITLREPLSFPAPESAHLEVLILDSSPELATRLMDDVAALTMFHELYELSLRSCRLQSLRSDLPTFLPRLHRLEITDNPLNCSEVTWLVKWLQCLNVSLQGTKGRRDIHQNLYRSYTEAPEHRGLSNENTSCATLEFPGKRITNFNEKNVSDERTKLMSLSTERVISDSTTEITGTVSHEAPSLNRDKFATSSSTETNIETLPTRTSLGENVSTPHAKEDPAVESDNSNITRSKQFKQLVSNTPRTTWKYSKNESELTSTYEPFIILLNDTKIVKVIDNHENDSISSGAFLGHEPPPSSHPGMVVFLLIVGVIAAAASAMVYSHCAQVRRTAHYHHHQDIEVSSFGPNDLW